MSDDGQIKLAAFCVFGGGAIAINGLRNWRKMRRTADVATSNIDSAPQGFVELQGFAWPSTSATQMNSINSEPCVYKLLKIQQWVSRNKSSNWETVSTFESTQPFFIVDETGIVKVIPTGFDFNLTEKKRDWGAFTVGERKEILKNMESSFLSSLPPEDPGFFSGTYRCLEQSILVGSPVLVHGNMWSSSTQIRLKLSRNFSNFFRSLNVHRKSLARIADFDRDGIISESEAIQGMHMLATKELKNAEATEAGMDEVILNGTVSRHEQYPSFIADCHQDNLIKRLGSWSGLSIWGGAALVVIGILVALNMFGFSDFFSSF